MTFAVISVLVAVAVLVAILLCSQSRLKPLGWLLVVWLMVDASAVAFNSEILQPLCQHLGTSVPWTGWARVAGHAYDALLLLCPASLLATCLVVYAQRSPWPALLGWASVVMAFVLAHPVGEDVPRALLLVEVLSVVASSVLFGLWFHRKTEVDMGQAGLTVFLLLLVAALISGIPSEELASRVNPLMMFGVLSVILLGWHISRRLTALEYQVRNLQGQSTTTAATVVKAVRMVQDGIKQQNENN